MGSLEESLGQLIEQHGIDAVRSVLNTIGAIQVDTQKQADVVIEASDIREFMKANPPLEIRGNLEEGEFFRGEKLRNRGFFETNLQENPSTFEKAQKFFGKNFMSPDQSSRAQSDWRFAYKEADKLWDQKQLNVICCDMTCTSSVDHVVAVHVRSIRPDKFGRMGAFITFRFVVAEKDAEKLLHTIEKNPQLAVQEMMDYVSPAAGNGKSWIDYSFPKDLGGIEKITGVTILKKELPYDERLYQGSN